MIYDVIVAGLGPAGATAAYEAGRRGLAVLGIDKSLHPRYKTCAGGLSTRIDKILSSDFHGLIEKKVMGIHFTYQGKEDLVVFSPSPIAYLVTRSRFDLHLVDKARKAGVEVREEEKIVAVRETDDHVEVETTSARYRGRVLVGADGANGMVSKQIGRRRVGKAVPAIESDVEVDQKTLDGIGDKVLIDFGGVPGGYIWIFPKRDTLSVGMAGFKGKVDLPGHFNKFQKENDIVKGLDLPKPKGYPIPVFHPPGSRVSKGRTLLAGDAANLVDPFFGEGIYYAVWSGQLAASSIAEALGKNRPDLSSYDERVRSEIYPELAIAARLSYFIYSFPKLWFKATQEYDEIIELYYQVLRGDINYQDLMKGVKRLTEQFLDMVI